MINYNLITTKDARPLSGYKAESSFHAAKRKGLIPQGIKLGKQTTRYIEGEILAVNCAKAAGATDEAIRNLISKLYNKRSDDFATLLNEMEIH